MLYRVEGLVIRSTDYGEGNKIITILTESYGKIGVMARGAKKMNSRHSAVTQLFTYGEFVYYRTGGQLGNLNHADILVSHHRLRENLLLSAYAAYLTEMTDRMTGDNEPQPYLFRQLKTALEGLADGKDAQMICHIFEMKILAAAGYSPSLDRCVSCGEPTESTVISISLGGVLCERCAHRDPDAFPIGESLLKLLRLTSVMDLARLGKVEVKPETKAEVKKIMRGWLDAHVGIRWRSQHVLEQMEKYEV